MGATASRSFRVGTLHEKSVCLSKRQTATTKFEKDFFKQINNSVYGKTLENKRKRMNIRLVTDKKKFLKLTASPTFYSKTRYDKNLIAVYMQYKSLLLDKPIYVGSAILELSKLRMYEFFYKFLKPVYNANLLFTDTDSFCVEIKTNNIIRDLQPYVHQFDFSNYPVDHPLYNTENKMVPGIFKDEWKGEPIDEYIGLKPKMYSILSSTTTKSVAKGIKAKFTHEHYRDCLVNGNTSIVMQSQIYSKDHVVHNRIISKKALDGHDDKRACISNNRTLALWHEKLNPFNHSSVST